MLIRKGIKLPEETEGSGDPVQRQHYYMLSIRLTLNKGEIVPSAPSSFLPGINQRDCGNGFYDLCTRINRSWLPAGLFHTVLGMRIGGRRKVAISPHLAYGQKGIPDVIPPNAKLIAEIRVLREADEDYRRSQEEPIKPEFIRRLEELRREQPDWP